MQGGHINVGIYWNGSVIFSGPVPRYNGGHRKMTRMSVMSNYNDLKNLVYETTRINPQIYDLVIKCNWPFDGGIYDLIDINDDNSVLMLITQLGNRTNQLFIDKKPYNTQNYYPMQNNNQNYYPMQNNNQNYAEPNNNQNYYTNPYSAPNNYNQNCYTIPNSYVSGQSNFVDPSQSSQVGPSQTYGHDEDDETEEQNEEEENEEQNEEQENEEWDEEEGNEEWYEESDGSEEDDEVEESNVAEDDIDRVINETSLNNEWTNNMNIPENLPDIFINNSWVNEMVSREYADSDNKDPESLPVDRSWVGIMFENKDKFTKTVWDWSLRKCVEYVTKKSEPNVWVVECPKEDCPWRIRAIMPKNKNYFKITKYDGNHTCRNIGGFHGSRQLTSKNVCSMILPFLRGDLTLSPKNIMDLVIKEYQIKISYKRAWRARTHAMRQIYGSWEDSYADMPAYLEMIKVADPNAVTDFMLDNMGPRRQFKRAFWAFGPSINGFGHCRPVVSIDGTHLYGKYLGCLLIATGVDGNRGIFPLAFAIVEKENSAAWSWFLVRLKQNVTKQRSICIITDRWRGHQNILAAEFPPEQGHVY